jgi:hypothetical protein
MRGYLRRPVRNVCSIGSARTCLPSVPQWTAYFEPNEEVMPFFLAVGRAVLAVSSLEKMLLLETARLLVERNTDEGVTSIWKLEQQLSRLERLTAGQLLHELRNLDLSPDLDERIGDVIDRRNDLVHHLIEDPQVVKAMGGEGMDIVVARIERVALDSAALAVELHTVAAAKLEAILGKTQAELAEIVKAVDPGPIEDPRARKQVEAMQALADMETPSLTAVERGTAE